ncbi:MAG: fimbrillin family protein [Bacteroidales bacterium]|nr:fimbrillin family protein [Bacteroidales bacterium]
MKTYIYTPVLSLLAAAMISCAEDTPVDPSGKPVNPEDIYVGDGSIVLSAAPDGFHEYTPAATRSLVAENRAEAVKWVDEKTGFMFTATSVPAHTECHDGDMYMSRAKPINNDATGRAEFMSRYASQGLRTTAYSYTGAWQPGNGRTIFHDMAFTASNSGDPGQPWRSATKYYWPQGGNVRFYSWTPASGLTCSNDGNRVRLHYTAPNFGCEQQDIMVAEGDVQQASLPANGGSECAPLTYKHIMAGLRVRLATRPGWGKDENGNNLGRVLNRFDFLFPYRSGVYDPATGQWSTPTRETGYWAWSAYEGGSSDPGYNNFENFKWEEHTYNDMFSQEQTYMLIPQNIGGGKMIMYYRDQAGNMGTYEYTFPDIWLAAGTITVIDIQEPSIFVEGYNNIRQTGAGYSNLDTNWDSAWPLPYFEGRADANTKHFFELVEDPSGNYYRTRTALWFDNPVPEDEEAAWNNNDRRYYGHRTRFNVLSRRHGGGNVFYSGKDIRFNFFICRNETYEYYERESNWHREQFMAHMIKECGEEVGTSPGDWEATDWRRNEMQRCGSGWEMMGGELTMRVIPDKATSGPFVYPKAGKGSGKIVFNVADGSHSRVRYPSRLPIGGSVEGFPQLCVQPLKGHDLWDRWGNTDEIVGPRGTFDNIRSFRCHYLSHDGNGIYKAMVNICQFAPFEKNNNSHWFADANWCSMGSFIMYSSTLHGSYGHKDKYPWDEFESRLCVSGRHGVNDFMKAWDYLGAVKGSIGSYSRGFTNSYIALPVGVYNMEYNMNTKILSWERIATIVSTSDPTSFRQGTECRALSNYAIPYRSVPYPGMQSYSGWTLNPARTQWWWQYGTAPDQTKF